MPKLLLIGLGPWSEKLRTIILTHLDYEIVRIGAREFVLGLHRSEAFDADIIWICSKPSIQIQVLEILGSLAVIPKTIVEKPYFTTTKEMKMFTEVIIPIIDRTYLSEPWTYSHIWQEFRKKILSKNQIQKISITRSGPSNNHNFLAPQDWLAHDINLLSSLARTSDNELIFYDVFWSQKNQHLALKADLGNLYSFRLEGGRSTVARIANWTSTTAKKLDETLTLDFNSMQIIHRDEGNSTVIENTHIGDQPVINMARNILESASSTTTLKEIRRHQILLPNYSGLTEI
jgi:hypothetical protein